MIFDRFIASLSGRERPRIAVVVKALAIRGIRYGSCKGRYFTRLRGTIKAAKMGGAVGKRGNPGNDVETNSDSATGAETPPKP
mgnify:CR=1 FL=1